MREQKSIFGDIDWVIVIIYLLLVFMGWLNIHAAVYDEAHKSIFDFQKSYGKQLIWIGSALFIAILIMAIDIRFFSQFAYGIYGFFILLLVAVIVAGKATKGAVSWFEIGSFKLQPSEFAKFATNLALAKYLSAVDVNIKNFKNRIYAIIILAIPALFILLQNDTGSALVYFTFILVLYREGMSGNILIFGLVIAFLFILTLLINKMILVGVLLGVAIVLVIFVRKNKKAIITIATFLVLTTSFIFTVDYAFNHILEDHQRTRINVLLGKDIDLQGAGYNVNQSKIAIGSGGFWGKGYLQGTQTKYNFVPEQSTDFIF